MIKLIVRLLFLAWVVWKRRTIVNFFRGLWLFIESLFSVDRWMEVFDTLRRNKLRTFLTAVSVGWGIFIMVVLLGLGHGFDKGLRYSFRREATNGIWIAANQTSIPYGGYNVGRKIMFDNRDYDAAKTVKGVEHLAGQYFISGGQFGGGDMKTQRGTRSNTFQINAVHPAAYYLAGIAIDEGRFLTDADITQKRKAAVIGRPVRDFLFANPDGKSPPSDPVGEWIVVAGVPFQVVGVFSMDGSAEEERQIFIPVSTAQLAFNGVDHLGQLELTVGEASASEAKQISKEIVAQLSARHNFSPDDPLAARVHDNVEGHERFANLFLIISIFVVLIGGGTLAAGVVGVSNIMMIAVKERTKEIGVRKALGATPLSIIVLITQEAVFITAIAGLLGLGAGVGVLGLLDNAHVSDMVKDPSIDLGVGIAATIGLILAGALAGYFPARAAARVNPIHTLRDQ